MVMRLSGLASGMDTEKMVQDLMKAQRMSYNNICKKKTQMEWKKADYNSLYTAISAFRDDTLWDYKMQNTVITRKATSANESIVTATASASAANMNHTINVDQLAEAASKTSSAAISVGDKAKLSTQLGIAEETFNLTINDGSTTKTISVNTGESINTLVSNINNAGTNIRANYDTTLDRFFLYTTNQGAAAKIDLTGNAGSAQTLLTELDVAPGVIASGQNAIFDLDGVNNLEQSSNTFTITGVNYTLNNTGNTTVNVTSDTEKAVEAVKTFVNTYNDLLAKINGELKEARYKGYLPLTDDEKADLKESQILAYEDKARSGLLRRDPILTDLVYKMRNDIAASVSGIAGSYTSLSSIGITIGVTTGDYAEGGKLYIDEEKLKAAIDADPDVLSKLFATNGATSSADGVATRLYDTLKTSLDKIKKEAGTTASASDDTTSNIAKRILDYTKRMTKENSRLNDLEKRYYRQFDAMEKALSKLNSQGAWLSQQLGG